MFDKWYAKGLKFSCTSCGRCCKGPDPGYVIMTEVDVLRLVVATGLPPGDFGRKYLRQVLMDDGQLVISDRKNTHLNSSQ